MTFSRTAVASISNFPESCTEQYKFTRVHISVFLGVKVKDEFPA